MGPSRCMWEARTLEAEALMRDVSTCLLLCIGIGTQVGSGVSVQGHGGGLGAGSFTCLNNNILRIECHWSAPELGQGPSPWLLFTSNHALGSEHRCVLRAGQCTLLLPPEEVLVPSDSFTITLHRYVSGKEQVSLVDAQYLPRRHVKLDPPCALRSNVTSHHCVLTWGVSPALEPLAAILSYELAFKKQEEAWEQARLRDHIVGVTRLSLEAVELEPGSRYEARLRVQMAAPETEVEDVLHYEGPWSDWSQPVCFPSPRSPAQGPLFSPGGQPSSSTLVAVPAVLLLTSLAYLAFKLSPRVKRSFCRNAPSPVAFFQPLYGVHNGDFQTWVGAHRTGVLPSQDRGSSVQEASESNVHEAITWLTYDPVDPWQSVVLEEQEEGPAAGLLEAVLVTGPVVQRGQSPAYLPQEDWAPVHPSGPAQPSSEGSTGDYWALGCSEGCHTPAFPGNTPSSGPSLALVGGLPCDPRSLDTRRGSSPVEAGHNERQDPLHGLHEGPRAFSSPLPLAVSGFHPEP